MRVILILIMSVTNLMGSDSIDFQKAIMHGKINGKPVLINFSASWCPSCKAFDKTYDGDSDLRNFINKETSYIKVDAESEFGRPLAQKYKILGYPTFMLLDSEDLTSIDSFKGYRSKEIFKTNIKSMKKPLPTVESIGEQITLTYEQYCEYQRLGYKLMNADKFVEARQLLVDVDILDVDDKLKKEYRNHTNWTPTRDHYDIMIGKRFITRLYTRDIKVDSVKFREINTRVFGNFDKVIPHVQSSYISTYLVVAKMYNFDIDPIAVDLGLEATSKPAGYTWPDDIKRTERQHYRKRETFVQLKMKDMGMPDVTFAYMLMSMGDLNKLRSNSLNNLAWFVFENIDKMELYVDKGIEYATLGVKRGQEEYDNNPSDRTSYRLAAVLDTLAELQSYKGDHESAIKNTQRAMELSDKPVFREQLEKFQKRLRLN